MKTCTIFFPLLLIPLFLLTNCFHSPTDPGPKSMLYIVYNNSTDYEIDIMGKVTIPPHSQKTREIPGRAKFIKNSIETNVINSTNGISSVIRFKNLKTSKVLCYYYKRDKDGKPLGFNDLNRHTFEDISSGTEYAYRTTYTFTDADVALADEKTCQEEEERLKKIGKDG